MNLKATCISLSLLSFSGMFSGIAEESTRHATLIVSQSKRMNLFWSLKMILQYFTSYFYRGIRLENNAMQSDGPRNDYPYNTHIIHSVISYCHDRISVTWSSISNLPIRSFLPISETSIIKPCLFCQALQNADECT